MFLHHINIPSLLRLHAVDQCWGISLEKDIYRRQKVHRRFPLLKIQWLSAVNGWNLDWNTLLKQGIVDENYQLSLGEIGCFLSHKILWEKLVTSNDYKWLILEDDIAMSIKWRLPIFRDYFINNFLSKMDYDLFLLGRGMRSKPLNEKVINKHVVIPSFSWQTHSYVITKTGAEKLLNHYQKIDAPLDEWYWQFNDLKLLALKRDLFFQYDNSSSTVTNDHKF